MTLRERVPLAPLTSLNVGGPARYFAEVGSPAELAEAAAFARAHALPLRILGGGTNVLVPDAGVEALVVHLAMRDIAFTDASAGTTLAIAEAGASWDALVEASVQQGLWGLENLSGIPGQVGGAVVGNIGAYGAAVSDTLSWVEAYHLASGRLERIDAAACALGYRQSAFTGDRERIVVRAAFTLARTERPRLGYRDLAERFAGQVPALAQVREAVLAIRRGKFPDLAHEGSAGSFFKNPIVDEATARAFKARYPAMPLFAMPETAGAKVPIAWLLDHILHMNGYAKGAVRLFETQPLVLVAARGARAAEVEALAHEVAARVQEECGITLTREVTIFT